MPDLEIKLVANIGGERLVLMENETREQNGVPQMTIINMIIIDLPQIHSFVETTQSSLISGHQPQSSQFSNILKLCLKDKMIGYYAVGRKLVC